MACQRYRPPYYSRTCSHPTQACAWEIKSFCKDLPNGHARIIRCLEENIENTDMSKECKDEVTRDNNRMGQDYRLNYRLNHACESDINRLCANQCSSSPGTSCGGLVLQCLQVRKGAGHLVRGARTAVPAGKEGSRAPRAGGSYCSACR